MVEYNDYYAFGKVHRPRWIRVDGPFCLNWSCQLIAPIPTESTLQWEGKMDHFKDVWRYEDLLGQSIGFVKIVNEFDKQGVFSGHHHVIQGQEIPGFNYDDFYGTLSAKLPTWMSILIRPPSGKEYQFHQGQIIL